MVLVTVLTTRSHTFKLSVVFRLYGWNSEGYTSRQNFQCKRMDTESGIESRTEGNQQRLVKSVRRTIQ